MTRRSPRDRNFLFRARTLAPTALIVAAVMCAVSAPCRCASGQVLDLTPRATPDAGEGWFARGAVTRLRSQLSARAAVRPPGDPLTLAAAAGDAILELTIALYQAGDSMGEPGLTRTVAAKTLDAGFAELDVWLTSATLPADAPAKLREMASRVADRGADIDGVLRDALGPLLDLAASIQHGDAHPAIGWPVSGAAASADPAGGLAHARRLALAAGASDLLAADRVDAALAQLAGRASSAPAASEIARTLSAATAAADVMRPDVAGSGRVAPPQSAPDPADLAREAERAITELDAASTDPGTRAAGVRRLERIAALGRLVAAAETWPRSAAARSVRAAVADIITAWPQPPTDTEVERWRALAVAVERVSLLPDARERINRNLRPALTVVAGAVAQARDQALMALPRAMQSPLGAREPAFLSALASFRGRWDDVVMIQRLSEPLDRAEAESAAAPRPRGDVSPWVFIRRRTLQLSQAASRAPTREAALAELRALAALAGDPHSDSVERGLRDEPDGRWSRAVGDARADLLALADARRAERVAAAAAAARAAAQPRPAAPRPSTGPSSPSQPAPDAPPTAVPAADPAADAAFESALRRFAIASLAASSDGPRRAAAWPGWEVTPVAAERVLIPMRLEYARVERSLRPTSGLPSVRDFVAAAERLDAHPEAMVIGEILLGLPDVPVRAEIPAALAQLAAGGPPARDAWMGPQRAALARISRGLDEIIAAGLRRDSNAEREWSAAVREEALGLLKDLELRRSAGGRAR